MKVQKQASEKSCYRNVKIGTSTQKVQLSSSHLPPAQTSRKVMLLKELLPKYKTSRKFITNAIQIRFMVHIKIQKAILKTIREEEELSSRWVTNTSQVKPTTVVKTKIPTQF